MVVELSSQAESAGCNDNFIALTRKITQSGVRIVYSRLYKRFNADSLVNDVKDLHWSNACLENDVNIALNHIMDKLV